MLELLIAGLLSASPGEVKLVPPLLLGDFGFPEQHKAQEPEPPSGFRGDSVDRQPRVVRAADADPDRTLDEPQWQTHSPKDLQLQIDVLRERRPSLAPPLVLFGLGAICAVAGGVMISSVSSSANELDGLGVFFVGPAVEGGVAVLAVGVTMGLIGLVWLMVDAAIRGGLDKQIETLEAELRTPERPAVISWTRGGASGLALAVPLQ